MAHVRWLTSGFIAGVGLLLLAGCNGPTKTGIEARSAANERMQFVRAQMNYDQAKQAFATGQFDKAQREILAALSSFPEFPEYLVLQARIHIERHRLEEAKRTLDTVVAADPSRADAYYFQGIVLQRWARLDEAATAYRNAYELQPGNAQYLLATAESLIGLQRLDEAQQILRERLSYFEGSASIRQLLGQIAMLEENPALAARLFEEARLLAPDDLMLLEDLARAQFAAGAFARCHHTVKQLQEKIGERADLVHMEARCLTMTDRLSEARNVYLRLTQITPADAVAWIELGNVAYELGDHRRVAMCSSRAIALAPERFEGHVLKGLYERDRGETAQAIESFRQAARLADDSAWPHLLLGTTLEDAGDRQGAMLAYGRALRIDPENHEALLLLNRVGAGGSRIVSEPVRND